MQPNYIHFPSNNCTSAPTRPRRISFIHCFTGSASSRSITYALIAEAAEEWIAVIRNPLTGHLLYLKTQLNNFHLIFLTYARLILAPVFFPHDSLHPDLFASLLGSRSGGEQQIMWNKFKLPDGFVSNPKGIIRGSFKYISIRVGGSSPLSPLFIFRKRDVARDKIVSSSGWRLYWNFLKKALGNLVNF